MRPTQARLGGGDVPLGKYGHYIGGWGKLGSQPQKGIITYGLSANRQNPFAGALHDAVFNTWRRFTGQFWYWGPTMIASYMLITWAEKKNHYLYSKAGRAEFGTEEEE